VTLGQLRTNQIFVTGDVARSGSYVVGSVGGVFNALYQAGGPTENGSFRNVEIHRGGLVIPVDLYSFLVGGRAKRTLASRTTTASSCRRPASTSASRAPPAGLQSTR
jgi:protein involved in polysaccharide export with SLBB domain